MDLNQPNQPNIPNPVVTNPVYTPAPSGPGMFGTKVPSITAFAVGLLLFLMPFVDIKCNGQSLQTISGVQLATGFTMDNGSSNNPFLNDVKTESSDEIITKTTTKTDKKDPNLFAMVALGLAALGLILSITNAKSAVGGAMATGIAAAAAMIGLMIDVKKKVKLDVPTSPKADNDITKGIDEFSNKMTDNLNITVDFTPWFYIAIIAFLAAAFFSYKRMQGSRIK